jgi:hypothetical protein
VSRFFNHVYKSTLCSEQVKLMNQKTRWVLQKKNSQWKNRMKWCLCSFFSFRAYMYKQNHQTTGPNIISCVINGRKEIVHRKSDGVHAWWPTAGCQNFVIYNYHLSLRFTRAKYIQYSTYMSGGVPICIAQEVNTDTYAWGQLCINLIEMVWVNRINRK